VEWSVERDGGGDKRTREEGGGLGAGADAEAAEALDELLEVDVAVAVLVEGLEQASLVVGGGPAGMHPQPPKGGSGVPGGGTPK